jgi:hypothetical protein
MNTNVSNHTSDIEQEEQEITVIRHELREETGGPLVQSIRPIVKWLGLLATFAWAAAALFPNAFRIPVSQQGWVFTIAIVWFFSYCAGLFNV